jgi:endonuclease YncB( thermonuclease family)
MRIFTLILSLILSVSTAHAVNLEEGIWEVLEGCRLVSSPNNDGDSFLVVCNNEKFVFRLYWVDALETTEAYRDRIIEQARYFSIPEEAVTDGGKLATNFTSNFLRGEFTVMTKWEDARGSPGNKVYFALVKKGDKYLSTELLLAGLARLYGKPTEEKWPGGVTPRTSLSRLKNNERQAQREEDGIWALARGSMQMEGLEALAAATVSGENSDLPGGPAIAITEDPLNVNTASASELDRLPGIGPALAARIIGARPILTVESMVEIPGISANTLAGFQHMVCTEDPPPPPFTVAFYKKELGKYLDSDVTVRVASVQASEAESPKSFRSVILETAYKGEAGGIITAYIPDEFYDSFINFYREPDREFTGLLYSREGEIVLVYPRQ